MSETRAGAAGARRVAFVPGRIGSTRLPYKNLALVGGEPLMAHAVRAALDSGAFERVVVNGDHEVFAEIAHRLGAEFYRRPAELGSSETRSDDVVLDFLDHFPCEIMAWVNPINPLQSPAEIRGACEFFDAETLDSLITVEQRPAHARVSGRPVNYRPEGKFERTQDLPALEIFAYSTMMWRASTFRSAMETRGYAFLCGRFGTFPVSRESAIAVKEEADLLLVDALFRRRQEGSRALHYDPALAAAQGARA